MLEKLIAQLSLVKCIKVHYSVCRSLPLLPLQGQSNLVHTSALCFIKIHFNITLPPVFKNFRRPFSVRFSDKIFHVLTCSLCIISCSHLSLAFIILTMLGETYKLWIFSLCVCFILVYLLLSRVQIYFSAPFLLIIRNRVSNHSYRTTDKIAVSYILT